MSDAFTGVRDLAGYAEKNAVNLGIYRGMNCAFLMNMNKLFILLSFLLLIPNPVQAESDCPSFSLDKTDPMLSDIPIWNQGATPSCYIYSSAFMATSWIRRHWPVEKDFVIDPAKAFQELKAAPADIQEPILDAENGRTCMSLDWVIQELAKKTGEEQKLAVPRCEMFGFQRVGSNQILRNPREFKKKFQQLLANREIFSIEYCSGVLGRPNGEFIKNRTFDSTLTYLNTPAQYKNFDSGCGFHVSVVVGQALREGKCHLRIRNSWGASNGEAGYNWVDIDNISKNTLRVVTYY